MLFFITKLKIQLFPKLISGSNFSSIFLDHYVLLICYSYRPCKISPHIFLVFAYNCIIVPSSTKVVLYSPQNLVLIWSTSTFYFSFLHSFLSTCIMPPFQSLLIPLFFRIFLTCPLSVSFQNSFESIRIVDVCLYLLLFLSRSLVW